MTLGQQTIQDLLRLIHIGLAVEHDAGDVLIADRGPGERADVDTRFRQRPGNLRSKPWRIRPGDTER